MTAHVEETCGSASEPSARGRPPKVLDASLVSGGPCRPSTGTRGSRTPSNPPPPTDTSWKSRAGTPNLRRSSPRSARSRPAADHPGVRRAVDLMLEDYGSTAGPLGGKKRGPHLCFTGNTARMMILFGLGADPRGGASLAWRPPPPEGGGGGG